MTSLSLVQIVSEEIGSIDYTMFSGDSQSFECPEQDCHNLLIRCGFKLVSDLADFISDYTPSSKKELTLKDEDIEAVFSGGYGLSNPRNCRTKCGEIITIGWDYESRRPIGLVGIHQSFTSKQAEFEVLGPIRWFPEKISITLVAINQNDMPLYFLPESNWTSVCKVLFKAGFILEADDAPGTGE